MTIRIDEAILVTGPPRSGALALARGLRLIPGLGGAHLNRDDVDPGAWSRPDGDRLGASTADAEQLVRQIERALAESDTESPTAIRPVLTIDGGALRIAAMARALPGARFVFVHRHPLGAIPALERDWIDGHPLADGERWRHDLIPGWAELGNSSPAAIAVEQWTGVTRLALDDLEALEPERWCIVDDALLGEGRAELERLCRFLRVDPGGDLVAPAEAVAGALAGGLPPQGSIELTRTIGASADQAARALELLPDASAPAPRRPDPDRDSPLRSVHTAGFAEILEGAGSSLLVSTYHAGSLVCLRPEGGLVNTHFRQVPRPMGLDFADGTLTVGAHSTVVTYRDVPELAPRVEPEGTHDACLLPRDSHTTGDVSVHDVARIGDETWIVATRFSCLATLDDRHSFIPRWTPPFITAHEPEDRCHLNGMCVDEGEIRWVTALGTSDEAGGWRERKADGGVLIDVPTGEVAIGGLSMPHSPRRHGDRLWLLESGRGALCVADPERGRCETVAELPGFTRGLVFVGDRALIGLSKIRETATFGGLPIAERLDERLCGVWAVDTRTGEIEGFLRFEDLVQEIYDLEVLPGMRRPEIADATSSATAFGFDLPGPGSQRRQP